LSGGCFENDAEEETIAYRQVFRASPDQERAYLTCALRGLFRLRSFLYWSHRKETTSLKATCNSSSTFRKLVECPELLAQIQSGENDG